VQFVTVPLLSVKLKFPMLQHDCDTHHSSTGWRDDGRRTRSGNHLWAAVHRRLLGSGKRRLVMMVVVGVVVVVMVVVQSI
jgi:hypothetical protein